MSEMIQNVAFLKRRIPKLRASWGRKSRENLLMWMAWHTGRYNACTVKQDGKILAVGVARCIEKPEDANIPYKSNENGKICYVEHTASDSKEGMQTLLNYVSKRWSHCNKIMFKRSKTNAYKMYDMQHFLGKVGY